MLPMMPSAITADDSPTTVTDVQRDTATFAASTYAAMAMATDVVTYFAHIATLIAVPWTSDEVKRLSLRAVSDVLGMPIMPHTRKLSEAPATTTQQAPSFVCARPGKYNSTIN